MSDPIDTELTFLDPTAVSLRLDDCGFLEGTVDGKETKDIRARAAFPFSRPDEYFELTDADKKVIGFVRHLDELDESTRAALRETARLQHFVPLITRIRSISGEHHVYCWNVATDRGPVEFHIQGRRQNIEEVSGDEYIVTATDGNRYRIPSIPNLDARSLLHLRKVL